LLQKEGGSLEKGREEEKRFKELSHWGGASRLDCGRDKDKGGRIL